MIERRNRLTIRTEWVGKNVILQFPVDDVTVQIPHDDLITVIGKTAPYLESYSWQSNGGYSTAHPNKLLRTVLKRWAF